MRHPAHLLLPALCLVPLLQAQLSPIAPAQQSITIPPEELQLRKALRLLQNLLQTMQQIKNETSARAAVPELLKIYQQLQHWKTELDKLPELDEEMQSRYEKAYLPLFEKLNAEIGLQADLLYTTKYYGVAELQTVLIQLVEMTQ